MTLWTKQSSAYVPLCVHGRRSNLGSLAILQKQNTYKVWDIVNTATTRIQNRFVVLLHLHIKQLLPECDSVLQSKLFNLSHYTVCDTRDTCIGRNKNELLCYFCIVTHKSWLHYKWVFISLTLNAVMKKITTTIIIKLTPGLTFCIQTVHHRLNNI